MAINKVVYGTTVLVDLSNDTVTAETLVKGETAHDKAGNVITGTFEGASYAEYDGSISGVGTLENTSWANIKAIAASGGAENCWAVGDTKSVVVNGTFGGVTLSNATYYVFILGFNHNATYEGNGIHFGCFKTASVGGTDIVFNGFAMNSTATNSGGWKSSQMRNTYCSAFLSCLSAELQAAIAECPKYTDNTGGGSNTASYITATSDKVFIPAEFEVYGARTGANSAEQNYQAQYEYFAAGNPKIRYRHDATATARQWWLRSVGASASGNFCMVYTNGGVSGTTANSTIGFCPCFKVG